MKVMVVHSRYRSGTPSGENRVVDQESAQLRELGHVVTRFERSSDQISGWPLARKAALPFTSVWNPEVRQRLRAHLEHDCPDVVHIHNTFPLLSASVLEACRDREVPAVVTLHNYRLQCARGDYFREGKPCHDCSGRLGTPAIRHGCYRDSRLASTPVVVANAITMAKWRRLVSAYIFVSAAQRKLLTGMGLPQERAFIKHNLVTPSIPSPAQTRDHMVAYVGRLDEAKGVPTLLAAWDMFQRTNPNSQLRLVIAGGGPLEERVRSWAMRQPTARFLGLLPKAAVGDLVCRSLAALITSNVEETFGLVVLEAMSVGVAPVATTRGAFPELITDQSDGVLFEANDPQALAARLEEIDQQPQRYVALGMEAWKTFHGRFSPDRNLRQLIEIYQFAIDNNATNGPLSCPG